MQSYQIKVRDNQLRLFDGMGGALLDSRPLAEGEIDALVAEINRYCQPPAPDIVAAENVCISGWTIPRGAG